MCSVEFHQKEKVRCRKLGTIRKKFVEKILWNSIKKKKFGVENLKSSAQCKGDSKDFGKEK